MHEVHVCGLTAGKTYYYQVGGGAAGSEVWSATQTFTTVPTTGKVTIGLAGDARDKVSTWQLVQQRMRDAAVNIQLFGGDFVDIGTFEQLYTAALDAAWKDPQDATKFLTLGQQMIVPIAGNHENEAARFYAAFAIPGDDPQYAETFASFNVGGVHVALIDDQSIATDPGGDPQAAATLAWLDKDLTAADADRANHPFVVVVSHRGVFSTSNHGVDPDVLQTRGKLAPLFDKHHVDLAVNGHDHEFEISKPLHAGTDPSGAPTVQPAGQGTVYLITAGAGAEPYDVGTVTADFRDTSTKFGNGTPYVGVYTLATIEGNKLTVTTYGLKAAGGGVSGDDVLKTIVLTH
jgi:predicted phosphodiesterase